MRCACEPSAIRKEQMCDFHRYEMLQCKIGAIASRTQKSNIRASYKRALLDIVCILAEFSPREAPMTQDEILLGGGS